jgi:hypothetical protein
MAVNMDELNEFLGNLGGAARAGVVVIGEKLGLYRAFPKGPSKRNRVDTNGEKLTRCIGKHGVTRTSGKYATGWRKRYQRFVLRRRLIAAAVVSCLLYTPSQSYSQCTSNYEEERVALELSALGKRGDAIARAREQVLEILQPGNACSAWFQESNSDPAEVFRSVHFELDPVGTSYAYGVSDRERGQLFKHPWAECGPKRYHPIEWPRTVLQSYFAHHATGPRRKISAAQWKSYSDGFSLHRGHSGSTNHHIAARTGAHHRAPS